MAVRDTVNLKRLKEEQEKALLDTENQLEQWRQFRSDYVALRDRLKTLPNKVTHNVMVPFGPQAFMPGQLVHTNEILVLLGDNYFVECSATQAADIVCRRLKKLDESTQALQKQKEMLIPRAEFTSDMIQMASGEGEQKEIVEEYDEERHQQWMERHREHLRREGEKRMKKGMEEEGMKETKTKKTDSDYWDILDRLEEQENKRGELENVTEEEEEKSSSLDESEEMEEEEEEKSSSLDESEEVEEEDSSEKEEEEDLELSTSRRITFSHTKQQDDQSSHGDTDVESTGDTDLPINSPADLYRFIKTSPKSILKPQSKSASKHSQGEGRLPQEDQRRRVSFGREDEGKKVSFSRDHPEGRSARDTHAMAKETQSRNASHEPHVQAFGDTVVERETPAVCVQQPGNGSTSSGPVVKPDGVQSTRPMSKFRASKQLKCDVVSHDSQHMDSAVQERDVSSARPVSRFRATRMKQGDGS